MLNLIKRFYATAPFKKPLPQDKVDSTYKRYRVQIFLVAYIGYLSYYFVRSTLALAKPALLGTKCTVDGQQITGVAQHFSMQEVGFLGAALAATYGLSKFFMGNVSDRSNPRTFLASGLIFSAIINIIFANLDNDGAYAGKRLGTGNGMASVRQNNDTLVFRRGTRN